jgi:glycine cleavage system regulatory protein
MFKHVVVSIIGADRPGLIQLVASRVADHGGNWLESRMCQLGGQFAGVARVEVPAERVLALQDALQRLEADGLRVTVDSGTEPGGGARGVAATIELVGHDRPGILRSVTQILAGHGVNVEELSSECISAPMGGGNLFQARVRVLLPPVVKVEAVRADLEKIAADMMVDLTLRPVAG